MALGIFERLTRKESFGDDVAKSGGGVSLAGGWEAMHPRLALVASEVILAQLQALAPSLALPDHLRMPFNYSSEL